MVDYTQKKVGAPVDAKIGYIEGTDDSFVPTRRIENGLKESVHIRLGNNGNKPSSLALEGIDKIIGNENRSEGTQRRGKSATAGVPGAHDSSRMNAPVNRSACCNQNGHDGLVKEAHAFLEDFGHHNGGKGDWRND